MTRRNRRRGQSLVELALTLPILLIALMGLIEFGMVLYAHNQVSNAAREAARAVSLYRSQRYANTDKSNPPNCASGTAGWSIQQVAEQAVVARTLTNQGCPQSSGTVVSSALGRLDPAPSTAWQLAITPAQSGSNNPAPGTAATVQLRYPYRLFIVSQFIPMLQDPVWISKSVQLEYQQ